MHCLEVVFLVPCRPIPKIFIKEEASKLILRRAEKNALTLLDDPCEIKNKAFSQSVGFLSTAI